MRIAVNAFAVLGVAAALQSALAFAQANAQEQTPAEAPVEEPAPESTPGQAAPGEAALARPGADRWVPSISVISGVTIQEWRGLTTSQICRGCTSGATAPLRPTTFGYDLDVTPFVGGSVELMTPELPLPGSPRLFVGGDMAATFGVERRLAREGDPSHVGSPAPPAAPSTSFGEDVAVGQGSKTTATFDDLLYGAHAGVAFPFELYGRHLRIKPSFAWIRYSVSIDGLVVDAECLPKGTSTECNTQLPSPGSISEIRLQAKGSKTFDGIGPGLDLELDAWRFGPFGSSIFVSGRMYSILGNRRVDLEAPQQQFVLPGAGGVGVFRTDTASARFSFEVDPWIYRVGVGLRIQWMGSK